jgi:hypothetical protein
MASVVIILLAACTSAVAFPVYSSSNGSVVVNTAYNGSLHLSAGSGTIVASSLFSADGGIGLNGTRLDEAYFQGVSGALNTLAEAAAAQAEQAAAQAAVNANVTNTLAAVLGGLSALQTSIGALAARVDAVEANTGLLDSLVVSPPMPTPTPTVGVPADGECWHQYDDRQHHQPWAVDGAVQARRRASTVQRRLHLPGG